KVYLATVSGGVSCKQERRRQMRDASSRRGIEFKGAEPWLCTDNAAMIAFAALLRLQGGVQSRVSEEIDPNLALVYRARRSLATQGGISVLDMKRGFALWVYLILTDTIRSKGVARG